MTDLFGQFQNNTLQTPSALGTGTPAVTATPNIAPAAPAASPTPSGYQNLITGYTPTGQAIYSSGAGAAPTPAPAVTPIGNPATPPANIGTSPVLPNAQAPTIADQFNISLSATLAAQQASLANALTAQTQNYQTKVDALTQQKGDLQALQETGLANENDAIHQETAAKQTALDEEQAQFKQNFEARQKLTDQLQTLLTQGQSVIQHLQNTSGLSSIMNARISETMASVQGQAGVITAALNAYDTQIGAAQSQLKLSVDAISSIYGDQINYWESVVSFYNDEQKVNDTQIAALTKEQQSYIDAQIQTLQDNVKNTQATAKIVQDAMLDPTKALAYAKAGVSLTDTPAQITQKLAAYETAQQNVWGPAVLKGGDYVQQNKLTGEYRTVVSNIAGAGAATGTAAERQAAQLQQYASVFVPGAKLQDGTPLIDNNGYATPEAWKQAIADFSGGRSAFIQKYGYLLYAPSGKVSPSYGLTPAEQKLITGTLPA